VYVDYLDRDSSAAAGEAHVVILGVLGPENGLDMKNQYQHIFCASPRGHLEIIKE
jgi:hypothetical protein